jgi:hypothetical protein
MEEDEKEARGAFSGFKELQCRMNPSSSSSSSSSSSCKRAHESSRIMRGCFCGGHLCTKTGGLGRELAYIDNLGKNNLV